jgi:predicted TIM-barrel fold metal-dependent hydrolase
MRVDPDRRLEFLAHAEVEARRRGLHDVTIFDCDCHHYETQSLGEIAKYIEKPAIRRVFERYSPGAIARQMMPGTAGDRNVAGRVWGAEFDPTIPPEALDPHLHPVAARLRYTMDRMAIDHAILFPTPMLVLGTHPQVEVEAELARAYDRWLVEEVLACDPAIFTMLYLPISDPDASLALIEELGGRRGVLGFMITAVRYQPIWQNRFLKVFAALNERRLPLAFHAGPNWAERAFEQFNRFLAVHALGFPFSAMVQLTNVILNGFPERFPDLRLVFMEAGVAWLPFIMQRLDNEYRMRSSEAPLLRRLPSEYIRECFFTTQPLERPERADHFQVLMEMTAGATQLLYASDYPHQDFDLPSTIWDLPVDEPTRRAILGGNALRLFGLPEPRR